MDLTQFSKCKLVYNYYLTKGSTSHEACTNLYSYLHSVHEDIFIMPPLPLYATAVLNNTFNTMTVLLSIDYDHLHS